MIRRIMAAMALPLVLTPWIFAQVRTPTIKLMFGEGVPYDRVWVGYGLFGPSGGRRFFNVPRPTGAPFYEIEALVDGNAVDRFKALVWAPGCKMKEFDVSIGTSNVVLDFTCNKLKGVTLVGRVQQVDLSGNSQTISIAYDTVGPCIFLDTCKGACFISCIGPPISHIATANLQADGTFKIELPDFSADPVASRYRDAHFEFSIGKGIHLEPEAKEFRSPSIGLIVASSYPDSLIFVPHKWD